MLVEVGAGEDVDGRCHGVTLRTATASQPTATTRSSPRARSECDAGAMPSSADTSPWESTVVLGNGDDGGHPSAHPARPRRARGVPPPAVAGQHLPAVLLAEARAERTGSRSLHADRHGRPGRARRRVARRVHRLVELRAVAGRDEAEAAFMVDDAHQGEGIATLMLEHLAAIARSNGIERFTAEVLADNRPMLAVFAQGRMAAAAPLRIGRRRPRLGARRRPSEFLDSVERREQRADSRAVVPAPAPAGDRRDRRVRHGPVGRCRHLATTSPPSTTVPVYRGEPDTHATIGDHPCLRDGRRPPDDVSLADRRRAGRSSSTTRSTPASPSACAARSIVTAVDGTDVDIDGDGRAGPAQRPAPHRPVEHGHRLAAARAVAAGGARRRRRCRPVRSRSRCSRARSAARCSRHARDLDLGVSWFVSLGDKADVSANDLLQFWEEDDATPASIAMYTESFGNPRKFAADRPTRLADHADRRRPHGRGVGRSPRAARCTSRPGVIEVPTVHALLDTARVLASQPHPRGPNIAVLTNSRSPGVLAGAALETAGLDAVDRHRIRSTGGRRRRLRVPRSGRRSTTTTSTACS